MNNVSHITGKVFWIIFASYTLFGMHFFMHNQGGAGLYLPFNMLGWSFIAVLISLGLWQGEIVNVL